MTLHNNPRKPNGHAGPHDRPNGHAPASTERGAIPPNWDQAASDDASGASIASAAASPAAAGLQPQASTDREACAEVAPPRPNGAAPRSPKQRSTTSNQRKTEKGEIEIPPGKQALPDDPAEFVEEIHRKVDITEVWRGLLQDKDDKIRQRAVEKLTEMRYKGAVSFADEPSQPIIVDIDSAVARRAAEGAKK